MRLILKGVIRTGFCIKKSSRRLFGVLAAF